MESHSWKATPENLRKSISYSAALQVSPVEQSTGREESCTNCDEMLTSDHQCDQSDSDEDDSEEEEEDTEETDVAPMDQVLCVPNVLCLLSAGTSNLQWIVI